MSDSADHPFSKELLKEFVRIGLPILLGVGPALYITNHQADLQREQWILDRKVTALKEFSSISWRGPAERYPRVLDLKNRVAGVLNTAAPDPVRSGAIITEYTAMLASFAQWGSQQASEAIIAGALMGVEAPRYPKVEIAFPRLEELRSRDPQRQRAELERLGVTLEQLDKKDVEFNLAVQDYVARAAGVLISPGDRDSKRNAALASER